MRHFVSIALPAVLFGLTAAVAGAEVQDKQPTPADQFGTLLKQFNEAARVSYLTSKTDEERNEAIDRIANLSPQFLALATANPKDDIALDALVQVVTLELYLVNNSQHPGRGADSLEARALAIMLRDHVRSDKLGEACRRVAYGFSRECEAFLRTVLETNPHRDVQGLCCLRLAQFLNARVQRCDLLAEDRQMAGRYERLFGADLIDSLRRRDRDEAVQEADGFFERAVEQYGDVKLPYADTVGVKAKSELHEIRHLSVGKAALEIEGEDQNGDRFKLSDYRGKVVLLYFWSEY